MSTRVTFDLDESHPPEAHLVEHPPGNFVSVHLRPDIHAFAFTRAQCDAAIRAFAEARELLPEPELVPCLDTGSHFPHGRCPGVPRSQMCDATTPTANGYNVYRCTLDAGHGGDHKAGGAGVIWPQDPPPLSRDLSGDLDAIPSSRIGDPAPAATTCPICGAPLKADGSHDTPCGTHIPATVDAAGTVTEASTS